jgi:amino acid permease
VAKQLHLPFLILLVWVAGGIYTLLAASCFTELGLMLPRAGGFYVYVRRAFGNTAGFAVGWTDWLTYCSVLGYLSIATAEFIGMLGLLPTGTTRLVSIVILVSIVALQSFGIRISSLFQELTTSLKCIAFLFLIAACLFLPTAGRSSEPTASSATFSGLIVALQAIVITYGGWQSPLYFIEENRDPARDLPRTMTGGVLSVIGIYLLVNIALLKVLPMPELSASTLPAADAARAIAGPHGRNLITLLSIISLLPLLNAIMMMGTRIIFAMGRDQLFWSGTASVNAGGYTGHRNFVNRWCGCCSYRNWDVSAVNSDDLLLFGSELYHLLHCVNRVETARTRFDAAIQSLGVSLVSLVDRCGQRDVLSRNAGGRYGERSRLNRTPRGRSRRVCSNGAKSRSCDHVECRPSVIRGEALSIAEGARRIGRVVRAKVCHMKVATE